MGWTRVDRRPVGVVIVTYNSESVLEAALDAVREADTVVVDNASTDGSVAIASGRDRVHVIQMPTNVGFGAACNRGIAHFADRDVFLMNPDVRFRDGGLDDLRDIGASTGAGILLPTLVFPDGTPQASTRPLPSLLELSHRLGPAAGRARVHGATRPVDWGLGAAMLIRRDTIDEVGGFDERFFLYFEDVDLCLRAWQGGHEVLLTSAVVMDHDYGRASSRKWAVWHQPVRWHWRSFARYVRKHPRQALRPNSRPVFGAV